MTITQTVEIPSNRRLTIDVPREVPTGQVTLTFTSKPAARGSVSLLDLRGSCKGKDTIEAYFERKRANKEQEDANDLRQREAGKRR